jgi:predicted DNA-binding transcriptional regulator AlpA
VLLETEERMIMARTILRLRQIEQRTGVPINTLRWLRHRGQGPKTFLLAGRVVAFEDDVDLWVERQRQDDPLGAA